MLEQRQSERFCNQRERFFSLRYNYLWVVSTNKIDNCLFDNDLDISEFLKQSLIERGEVFED